MTFNQAFALVLMGGIVDTYNRSTASGWKSLVLSVVTVVFCRVIWWFFVDRKGHPDGLR